MQGFGGQDVFVFNTALSADNNVDTIIGYSTSKDIIHLDNAVFAGLADGALAAGAFRIGSAALDADDRIIYDGGPGGTGALIFDANGSAPGGDTVFAHIGTGLPMTHAEFFVI